MTVTRGAMRVILEQIEEDAHLAPGHGHRSVLDQVVPCSRSHLSALRQVQAGKIPRSPPPSHGATVSGMMRGSHETRSEVAMQIDSKAAFAIEMRALRVGMYAALAMAVVSIAFAMPPTRRPSCSTACSTCCCSS